MEPVVTREQLLAVLAKQLPATISPSELEDGLDMAIELPDERESGSRTSTGTTNTTAFSVHIRSTRLQADSLKRAFKRESSSFLCEDPGSVNSMTGELHYRELFEKMQMAAALHEVIVENGVVVDTRFKDINPYFCKLFGLDREEIVGHRMTQIFPGIEDDKANWIANFGRTGLEGRTFEFNTFSQHLGQWYAGVAYRPDPSRTDFCCVFVDSSKDVNHQVELEESEERHRNLFECMGQGVVYQDADGQIIMANPAAERILGLTVDQMRGRQSIDPRWRAMRADGSDFPGEEHPSMVALRTGEKQLNVIMGVYHPGEDSHHWIKVDAIPRFHKGSTRPYQVYGTFTDITDDKRSSEALLIAKEEAQRADALKSSFLANMSHEIRTPLNGIMGYIDLALSNRLSVDHQQENIEGLQIAKCSGELLLSIIEDILDISKIEAGALELEDEVFSLQEVFSATTSLAQTLVVQKKKDIRIVSTMCQEISDSIRGDSFRLQQILNNLVSNSGNVSRVY
jgi:PAS domain S-box-containing protein